MSGTWNADLMCNWTAWIRNSDDSLQLHMPKYNCSDMRGTIKIAKFLMPEVKTIFCMVDGVLDYAYTLSKKGKWVCREVRRTQ